MDRLGSGLSCAGRAALQEAPEDAAVRLNRRTVTMRTAALASAIWRTKLPSPSELIFQM
jgi:hypothetical protein